jgi:hypothetical protein
MPDAVVTEFTDGLFVIPVTSGTLQIPIETQETLR